MTKRVESVWFPCLDEGSTPSSSTKENLIWNKTADYQLIGSFVFLDTNPPCVQNLLKQ